MGEIPIKGTKEYLGDSVYAQLDREGIVLTTENGLATDPSNCIFMEPAVVNALMRFIRIHSN